MNRRPRLRVLTGLGSESDPRSASGSGPKPLVVVVTGEEASHRRKLRRTGSMPRPDHWTARAQVLRSRSDLVAGVLWPLGASLV